MSNNQVNIICSICSNSFQFGPNIYRGQKIKGYEIMVCNTCYAANWDGWAPHLEHKLVEHLGNSQISVPPRNSQGWLPREF